MVEQEDVGQIVDFLKSLILEEMPQRAAITQEPGETQLDVLTDTVATLKSNGFDSITAEDLDAALTRVVSQLDAAHSAEIDALREAIATQPPQVIQQIIDNTKPADQVTVVRHITNVTNVEEGDQVVDQRVINRIRAEGDVEFDQQVENQANVGDDGAVVVGGNVQDSAVNTGTVDGVQAAGEVKIEDSAIGDNNVLANDSQIDALAVGGDATSVEAGGDANVGSGTQVNTEAGGDVQTIVGDENKLVGDQTANIGTAPAVDDGASSLADEPDTLDSAPLSHADLEQQVAQSIDDGVLEELDS